MKIVTIVGARPQFIKAAAVSRRLRPVPGLREVLVHTGQHYDANMSDVFFEELGIPQPDRHLGIGSGSHGAQTGRMLEALDAVIAEEMPDWVLVYGDTNSTAAGALAAAKLHVRVAHVEAGLRSFNRRMPEELNRIITDHLSDLMFAPTRLAVDNLRAEGRPRAQVRLVGDVMYDAALYFGDRAEARSSILEALHLESGGFVLATLHRAENTDDPDRLRVAASALSQVSVAMPVVLPLHPRTRGALARLSVDFGNGVRVVEPLGYLDMVMLEKHARLIATDSGGVQKEAFFHRVPCVTLRAETEWVELLDIGWNRLAPPISVETVTDAVQAALSSTPRDVESPYGDGHAADLIVDAITGC